MEIESSSDIKDSKKNYKIFEEGKVKIAFDENAESFYNPVQEFNRDLTIFVLRQFSADRNNYSPPCKRAKTCFSKMSSKIQILDALSASGLRALRFSKEVPDVDFVIANDFSENAFTAIKHNIKLNGLEELVKPSYGDAVDVMMAHRSFDKRFHVIDLDPYGSAAIFLDSAVQAVIDGGILMVTCTDTATLCGNTPEACFNKYNSIPLRHRCCHEFSIRILLKCIDSHANLHGRYIKPLLCVSVDFYIRCFVQVFTSALKAKDSVAKLSHVLACASCKSLEFQAVIRKVVDGNNVKFSNSTLQSTMATNFNLNGKNVQSIPENDINLINSNQKSLCAYCKIGPIHIAGPIYMDPLYDKEFVNQLLIRIKNTPENERLKTHDRLIGLLTVLSEEIYDAPLYYEIDNLMNVVQCSVPKHVLIRSAIINANYKCSISHCNPKALKTNAPVSFLWDVCRAWAKFNNVTTEKVKNNLVAFNILSSKSEFEINFSLNKLAMPKSKTDFLLRFPDNKGKDWGPKRKAAIKKNSIT